MDEQNVEFDLIIKTNDSKEFKVKKDVIGMSVLIADMITDPEDDDDDDKKVPVIPIDLSEKIFKKVLDFCIYSKDKLTDFQDLEKKLDIKPLTSKVMKEVVPEWYAEYMDIIKEPDIPDCYDLVELQFLINLILAANYLHISSLLNLTCIKVGTLMKGKMPEVIKKQWSIKD